MNLLKTKPEFKKDFYIAFLWSLIVLAIIIAPNVFSNTVEFVYAKF